MKNWTREKWIRLAFASAALVALTFVLGEAIEDWLTELGGSGWPNESVNYQTFHSLYLFVDAGWLKAISLCLTLFCSYKVATTPKI